MFAPISSTKTNRSGSTLSETHPPGSPSGLVSLQRPHSPFFRLKTSLFKSRFMVERLRLLPIALHRKWRLSEMVAAGRSLMSASSNLSVVRSASAGHPPPRGSPQALSQALRGPHAGQARYNFY